MNALSIERTMWHNNVRHSDIAYVLKAAAVFARAVRSKSSAADQSFPNREAHITQRGWTDLINPLSIVEQRVGGWGEILASVLQRFPTDRRRKKIVCVHRAYVTRP